MPAQPLKSNRSAMSCGCVLPQSPRGIQSLDSRQDLIESTLAHHLKEWKIKSKSITKKENEMGDSEKLLNYRQRKISSTVESHIPHIVWCPTLNRIREQGTFLLTQYWYITSQHVHMNQKHNSYITYVMKV